MRTISKLVATAFISAATFAPAAMAQDRIEVGSLNGQPIFLDELITVLSTLPAQVQQAPLDQTYVQLINEVANVRLAAELGRDDDLLRDDNVELAVEFQTNRILANVYLQRAVQDEITDEAVETAYDAYVANEGSRQQVEASHILVGSEDEANDIIDELNDGANFAQLARSRSTGPSASDGGSLGSFGRGEMVPAFENAAFSLSPGSYSNTPVQTPFGWHVIMVEGRVADQALPLDDVRNEIEQFLANQAIGRIVQDLRAGSSIVSRPFEDIADDAGIELPEEN